ncbi:hypothetical protein [Luteolibacter soli]|uniref:Uncharacterized protein n=1 Tax=Luteolibacter soli TaxID=3135280 RepID=A0ABU9AV73_9BACT
MHAAIPPPRKASTWICDSCREEIATIEEGWVEWLVRRVGDTWMGHGLRLVHHHSHSPASKCQYPQQAKHRPDDSVLLDLPLKSLLGPDGLMELLRMLAQGELPQAEVIEMIKRLHIPGYEHARLDSTPALAVGAIDLN